MKRTAAKIVSFTAALLLLTAGSCTVLNGIPAFCTEVFAATDAENAQTSYEINSADDFVRFARACRVNTWSDGMTVNLNADLNLEHESYTNVAYFNGTFNGNSHKITNLKSSKSLFQTIGPNGKVTDLELHCTITSDGDNTAAFVSKNNGRLESIRVDGTVSGKVTTGILAAVNEVGGRISACKVSGEVSGTSSTGGIAGKNSGSIFSCINLARVNTTVEDKSLSADDVQDILQNILISRTLNSTENLRVQVDAGGIAGYNLSSGLISDCVNEGAVGYPHVGYNTGGICGRNGGAVETSVNRGKVFGRKDVGGITGHQQPEIMVDFSEDVLSSISDEMDGINVLITDTLNTSESITDSTSDRLSGISNSLTDVKNSTRIVYDASLERFDEAADSVNSTVQTITDTLEDISVETGDLTDAIDRLGSMSDDLSSTIDSMAFAFGMSDEEKARIQNENARLREDLNYSSRFVEEVRDNLLPVVPEERRARINDGLTRLNRLSQDVRAMRTMFGELQNTRDRIADGSVQTEAERRDAALGSSISSILDSMNDLDRASGSLSDFSSALGGTLHDTAGGIDISLEKNEAVRAAGEDIYAGLDRLTSQMDSLNAFAREESMEVIGNLNEINRRFNGVMDLLKNERDRLNDIADDGGIFVDNSELADSPARIHACINEGDVRGDMTTGGIAGTIGIEFDVDPEKDILRNSDRSLDYTFGVTAVISESDNTGNVEGKGSYTGGITGKMDMGRLLKNRNYGDVSSENGDFTGGIAGYADGSLDGNSARCRVNGGKNCGGIAGYGKTLRENTAVVAQLNGEEYTGAIAGRVDALDGEKIRNNLYYAGSFGGIDNIDYTAMAEKASEPLDTVLVKFLIEGRHAGMGEVKTGTLLKELSYPEAEKREGFLLIWDKDGDTVLNEDTVVNAAYHLAVAVLSAPQNYAGTNNPVLMADGAFREEDRLGFASPGHDHYQVTVPDDGLAERKIRVHKPGYKRYTVFVNGAETPVEAFGDYLTFTTGERELEILIQKAGFSAELLLVPAAALIIILVAAAVLKKKRKASL